MPGLPQLFIPENVAQGVISQGTSAGVTDSDEATFAPDQGVTLPWPFSPVVSWLDYQCWLEIKLDAGFVCHKPLPQSNPAADTLAAGLVNDPQFAQLKGGVNLVSNGGFSDIVQRMATSTYKFILKGSARRAGYQIPVPGLVSIAGVTAYPDEVQWSLGNRLDGNAQGIPIWVNAWWLEYFVILPPKQAQQPPPNLAQFISALVQPSAAGILVAQAPPDQYASQSAGMQNPGSQNPGSQNPGQVRY
jgi:hypothetical protein